MKTRIFTYVECACGHQGALIETIDTDAFRRDVHRGCLRDLVSTGTYEGNDALFAMLKPACPECERSLSPDDMIGRSELHQTDEVFRLKPDASVLSTTGDPETRS